MREEQQAKKVIGLDAHPYLFSAAALSGGDALHARIEWQVDRIDLRRLESILKRRGRKGDTVVLEASGNSFAVAERIQAIGLRAIVLESQAVGKVGKAYCATDKIDAVKIARVYLSGLAHEVWKPNPLAAERRELFFAYRNAVRDSVRERNRIWGFLNQQCQRRPRNLRLAAPTALPALLALREWTPMQSLILAELVQAFQAAEARRKHFGAKIAEEVASNPDILKMIRLLGVRDKVAFALAALARKLVVSVWCLLRGFFTPMTEIPKLIQIKMHKIASSIGKKRIMEIGFASLADFEKEKWQLLLGNT